MSLLTNMSIERTNASMNASTNPAGYRYIGGDGINVDNEVYQITAKCDGDTIIFNSEGQLTVSSSLYAAGDNIVINEDDYGRLTISAAMFQSQFQEGDRDRYEIGLYDINSLRIRVSGLEGRATTVEGRADGLTSRMDTAEGNITSQGNRIEALEDANPGILTRISDIEHDLNTATTGLKDVVAGHTQSLIDHTTDITDIKRIVDNHTDFIEDLSGLDGTLGGYGSQISDLQLDVQDLESADSALGLRIDGNEDRLDALELTVNGRSNDPNGEPNFNGHEQRLAGLEYGVQSATSALTDIDIRILALENVAGIGEGAGNSGIAELRSDVDALQQDMTQAQSDISDLQIAVASVGDDATTAIGDAAQVAADLAAEIADRELDEGEITSNLSGLTTRVADVEGNVDIALSRLTTLDNTTIPELRDDIQQLETTLSADITQNTEDIATNAAAITAIDGELSNIWGGIRTNEQSINSHTQSIQTLQNNTAKRLANGYNVLPASDIHYQSVSAGTPYDDTKPYFVRNEYTYSPAYISPSSVNSGDTYDGSKTYYTQTGENTWTPYTYVDQETWETDVEAGGLTYYDQQVYLQVVPPGTVYDSGETYVDVEYQPYTYVDAETWETDLDAGTVYTTYMIPLYTESAGVYSAVSTSVPLDPNVTYYNQNEPTYSMIAAPEMEKVESSMVYRNDVNYYNRNRFGYYVYNEYAGGQSDWEADRDAGKVYTSPEWEAITIDGIYEVNAAPEDGVAQINTQKDCYAIINSGIGNAMLIYGTVLNINVPADPNGGIHIVTVPMAANETITVSATPGKRGTAVLGDIIIKTMV